MRIMYNDSIAIGPGKVALLEAIHSHGSITAAAKSLNMSYRRAWVLLDEINSALRSPATISSHGGKSLLTDYGHKIIALYRQIEQQADQANKTTMKQLLQLLKD